MPNWHFSVTYHQDFYSYVSSFYRCDRQGCQEDFCRDCRAVPIKTPQKGRTWKAESLYRGMFIQSPLSTCKCMHCLYSLGFMHCVLCCSLVAQVGRVAFMGIDDIHSNSLSSWIESDGMGECDLTSPCVSVIWQKNWQTCVTAQNIGVSKIVCCCCCLELYIHRRNFFYKPYIFEW